MISFHYWSVIVCFAEDGRSKMVIETKPIELSTALKVKEIKTSKTSTSEIVYEKLPKPKSQEIIRYIRKDGTVIDHLVSYSVATSINSIIINQSGRPADAGLPDFSLCSLRSHEFTLHPF
ncbi:hypothetical protein Y032_0335g2874 [Ancylostoma ceylanicum]|uniref:Uncharacterized protein n=1 Tax=Ancylostoma ceylanicum TaxID=53326 RepID=A0A016RYL8_9BILA|nr:hypothetical protein Y032_0335g2874 [Ancylostoma ceylanicum]